MDTKIDALRSTGCRLIYDALYTLASPYENTTKRAADNRVTRKWQRAAQHWLYEDSDETGSFSWWCEFCEIPEWRVRRLASVILEHRRHLDEAVTDKILTRKEADQSLRMLRRRLLPPMTEEDRNDTCTKQGQAWRARVRRFLTVAGPRRPEGAAVSRWGRLARCPQQRALPLGSQAHRDPAPA